MRVWVIRHGESETNKNGLWTGWLDAPLTEKGREDALLARSVLSGVVFDKIYSSDLKRAKSTAEIAIPGCEYESTGEIREIDVGSIAGKPLSVIYDGNDRPLNEDGYGRFGGESKEEFRARVASFMKRLEEESFERVAVFCHGGVLRRFLEIVLGAQPARGAVTCGNCTVAIFDFSHSTWKLHSWINLQ